MNKKMGFSVWGYLIFFITVAVIITCAVLLYSALESIQNIGIVSLVMFLIIAFLSAVCTVIDWFRRKWMVEKPVRQILDATEKIAGGNFEVRLKPNHPYDKYDEYDLIFENLNQMAAELSHNELLKSDFISNVSHEIKTPLAILSNHAQLLQDESLSEEERQDYTKTLLHATKRLSDLITNILKLNKLENQVIQEEKVAVHFGDFLGEIVLSFEEMIAQKKIELNCQIDDIVLEADQTYLEIICYNLLSNAVKFTSEGGQISIRLKETDDSVLLEVADTGCGMTKEQGARIFDKFYQADPSHKQQGNGLGLALVKKVIDNIGGEILVESEIGKGSRFVVTLKK